MNLTEREIDILRYEVAVKVIEDYKYSYNKTTTGISAESKDDVIEELADSLEEIFSNDYDNLEEKDIELAKEISILIGKVARARVRSMGDYGIVIY